MPYLSNNYRCQPKSKIKNLIEATLFVLFSTVSILITLVILGYFSSR